MRSLVVIPTYQEVENIDTVLRRVRAALPDATVLVVDDDSRDGTVEAAEAVGAELGQIEILRRSGRAGLGAAYRAGFAWGLDRGAEILIEMDADLSHDPASLPALVAAIDYGADLVIGSRYVPGGAIHNWTRRRAWLSRWGNRYAALSLGLAVNDATSGYRAYRADALRRFELATARADGYCFQVELTYRVVKSGGRVVEVPIQFIERVAGESKMSWTIIGEAFALVTGWGLRDLFRGRRRL